ncbi:CocE/NonD family hydrolase [Fundidesulfovibrio putealis]|uniref:CocE/NonD family hydrolase n=1 Tax=Fundidesulfovibrio putealis TaxID=270496 RepID=UPI00040B1026|nr:CocE/NonD family hydrolase [Fundidesulfovibrio putealis]
MLAALLACLLLLGGLAPGGARSAWAALLVEEMSLPARFSQGGPPTLLEAVVVRPGDASRHPLVVISHGTPRDPKDRPGMNAISRLREAEEFARRGFVVLVFMRRGYGSSAGGFVEGVGPGDDPDYAASGRKAAEDIREAIRFMKTMPYVDPDTIICVGQSAGGLATLALASDPPQGVVAVINFAGGKGSKAPDVVIKPSNLVSAFAQYGRTARVPALFVYSENDRFFGPGLARELYAAYTSAGGKAQFVMAPAFGEDGHTLFSRLGIPQWTPYVDAFLATCGLRQRAAPMAVERPKVPAPRKLSEKGRTDFENYLESPPHKSFFMGSKGGYGWASGKRTAEEAARKALENCEKFNNTGCAAFMIDDTAQ